jgi:hypothetical protein
MRVEASARPSSEATSAARFGDALARAERAERSGQAGRSEARAGETRAGGARAREARTSDARPSRPSPRAADPRRPGGLAATAAPQPDALRVGAAASAGAQGGDVAAQVAPVVELARVARAVPVAIASLGPPGSAPLALSFGRSLDVELRATAAGVDVVLRPEPRLARAAEAELPGLVAALRGRGISVAAATVRPRGPSGGRAR